MQCQDLRRELRDIANKVLEDIARSLAAANISRDKDVRRL